MDLSIWGAAGWRPQLDGRPHLARRQRCNSQRQLLLGVRAAFESYCDTLHAAGTDRALHQLGVVKTRLGKLARESRFASASGNGTNGFCCSNQRGWSSKRSITPVVRPQMAALGQAALSVDSPDHSAAQVLAFMHGPEAESTENSAVATAKPKGAGGGTTSREDMPLATLQDNNERDSVVKIVWTAEEDQQLLQVRPEYSLPLWNGSIAPCTHSHWHSVRNVPSRH